MSYAGLVPVVGQRSTCFEACTADGGLSYNVIDTELL